MQRPSALVAIAVALACLACGVSGGAASSGTREACEAYVAHMNTLTPCMGVTYDVDNICDGSEGAPEVMTAYYDCLRDNASCDGLTPVLQLDACEQPVL